MVAEPSTGSLETAGLPLSRRSFLRVGAAAGGGLLLGFMIPAVQAAASTALSHATFTPNAFIRIGRDGVVTLTMPQVEMGQGIYTAMAMLLADELDAVFDRITLEVAGASDSLYTNPALGLQMTGGSTSIRAFWLPMRKAGASARAVLVQAAAKIWHVVPARCRTAEGNVIHDDSRRRLPYGELVDLAARLTPSSDPALKAPKDFKLIGHPTPRLDTPDKVNGKAVFGIDARPPGVKIATLKACPVFGGKIARVDDRAAHRIRGVRQVVVLDDLVAVVGDHMWAAKQGLEALDIVWDDGANAGVTSDDVLTEIEAASKRAGAVARSSGDAATAMRSGKIIEATYRVPFLAHAPMEPMNCTVHVRPDACEIWVGSQVLSRTQATAAQITGLPCDKVIVHNHLIGGTFGRRLEIDGIAKAVRIAQAVNGPVKVIWTREEDIQQAMYRPAYFDRLQAALSGGRITAWSQRIVGSSVLARFMPSAFKNGLDGDAVAGAVDFPYDVANIHVEYVRQEPPAVPTCFWRGVGPTHNIFVVESFVDELAHSAGKDPVEFRRSQLQGQPRLLACLNLAAAKIGWGQPLPARVGRGVSVQNVFGTNLAAIAEVEVDQQGEVTVRRVVCAVDCGTTVNPDTVIAQIQGGLIFGLTAALHSEITIAGGRVKQSNFNNYRVMRINEAPSIEVHLIPSVQAPGGVGEPGTVAAAGALGNALFAATSVRLRRLPVDREALAGRKPA
jgi:isoquinoline 1-oxidoreductase beta subunit